MPIAHSTPMCVGEPLMCWPGKRGISHLPIMDSLLCMGTHSELAEYIIWIWYSNVFLSNADPEFEPHFIRI